MEMMSAVSHAAAADAGAPGLLSRLDSVQVVSIIAWQYPDAPGMLAQRIGATPSHTLYSSVGGETPQRLINEAGQAIVEGRIRIALIAGVGARQARRLARKAEHQFPWTRGAPERIEGDMRNGFNESEAKHAITRPTDVYAL